MSRRIDLIFAPASQTVSKPGYYDWQGGRQAGRQRTFFVCVASELHHHWPLARSVRGWLQSGQREREASAALRASRLAKCTANIGLRTRSPSCKNFASSKQASAGCTAKELSFLCADARRWSSLSLPVSFQMRCRVISVSFR